MVHKYCFEVVGKLLGDIIRIFKTRSMNLLFGGKVIVCMLILDKFCMSF